ncbi:MAG: ATP-binding cassette domain-containing protein [Agathobacter sp.]|nr:ATP-binding cassette domain-containing protein [Agathobacter sp.]
MENNIISIEHLSKKFGNTTVLNDVTISFEKGKIYGIVGRNGSGKTMLMKCICGFVNPTFGKITVSGKVVGKDVEIPEDIGIIIETPGFVLNYSGYKNLKLLASVRGKITNDEIIDAINTVGLNPESKKHVGKYSLGMRQRLGIAQAIMEKPKILILDEPMNGLDNDGVAHIRDVLLKLKKEKVTIILASHNKEDVEILCDEVCYMDKGQIKDQF